MIEVPFKSVEQRFNVVELPSKIIDQNPNSIEVKHITEKIERVGMGYENMPKFDLTIDDLYSDFKESHKRTKMIVEECINGCDLCSNNDFILFIEVLRILNLCQVTSGKDNFVFKIKREDLKKIIPSESVTRARRLLNSEGKCLASDERVLVMRKTRELALRKYFSNNKHIITQQCQNIK